MSHCQKVNCQKSIVKGSHRGQAALSVIFLIGTGVVVIAATLAFLSLSFLSSRYGVFLAQTAYSIASAGAQDAILQLARNKDFPATTYTVPINSNTASVTITRDSPVTGQVTILSTVRFSNYVRKVQAVVSMDSTTGQVQTLSWQLIL